MPSLKNNYKNLIQIIKYSDNEPLELVIAFVRLTIFPISSLYCPWTPGWLIIFGMLIGAYQIWATTSRILFKRHQANFASLLFPIILIANMFFVGEVSVKLVMLSFITLICLWNFWKTGYQIKLRGCTKKWK